MRTWRRLVLLVVIAATAALLYRWWLAASSKTHRASPRSSTSDGDEPTGGTATATTGLAATEKVSDSGATHTGPKLDRAQADRMREEIRSLLVEAGVLALAGEPIEAAAPAPTYGSMPVLGVDEAGNAKVDPKYIQARVREDLFPLALDCYTDALKRTPTLAGKLVVYFRVIGDHKVGGVVDEAKLVDGTTIDDRDMQTCVRESMMSVSFDAPPQDGELTVVYPIEFSPDDPD